jgi:hypothetical protein
VVYSFQVALTRLLVVIIRWAIALFSSLINVPVDLQFLEVRHVATAVDNTYIISQLLSESIAKPLTQNWQHQLRAPK